MAYTIGIIRLSSGLWGGPVERVEILANYEDDRLTLRIFSHFPLILRLKKNVSAFPVRLESDL